MPNVEVVLFQEDDGSIPLRDWLDALPVKARVKCLQRLNLLSELGHELRRPHAEYLEGTDLYELRVRHFRVQYRMLYFFHGQEATILSHGFSKEGKIPPGEIALATERMTRFRANPGRHAFRGEG